ncbi:MoaD/ThiS family protein [Candidatus Oleimmundimicrobium sp.]|uniref:MoaD/ThiS family protein n=1 Tax=Candidatus Oleimmundimicrobium sp. TaxID=3060597 RepID=UPI0027259E30|nr:MoaD/ThiS family protein [Candidatus Oleimmundimicrobium sp.]MDO8885420.1 MoaD/ThiS family protein [Candidatus Oleimmundimicrobium sp.]
MKIELRFYATLIKYAEKNKIPQFSTVEIEEGTTIASLLNKFNIPEKDVHIIIINGRNADSKQVLQDGDRVALFPPVGGG